RGNDPRAPEDAVVVRRTGRGEGGVIAPAVPSPRSAGRGWRQAPGEGRMLPGHLIDLPPPKIDETPRCIALPPTNIDVTPRYIDVRRNTRISAPRTSIFPRRTSMLGCGRSMSPL